MQQVLAVNRRLFEAHYVNEQAERLWSFAPKRLRCFPFSKPASGARAGESVRLSEARAHAAQAPRSHPAHCRHKARFGLVEAIHAYCRSIIRTARGYEDDEYPIVKGQGSAAQRSLGAPCF
jgi:hypothetical protein